MPLTSGHLWDGEWDADAAVEHLYAAHYVRLVRLAVLLVGDVETAEEVVQDSFVAMHGRWRSLNEPDKALAYLRRTVVNRARSVLRHRGVRARPAVLDALLLEEAVADVRPRHGLDEIRARTADSRVRRPWGWGVAGTVIATAGTVAAVAVFSMPGVRHGGPGPDRVDTPPATPLAVRVYFLGDTGAGPRLFQESHLTSSSSTDPTLDAVQQAVDGRSHDPDYRTAWPTGTQVDRVDKQDHYVLVGLSGRVDLTRRPASMSPALAQMSVQQLIWTAQSNADNGRLPILFEVDGAVRPTLLGVPDTQPLHAATADNALAPVSIDTPRQSDQSSIPVTSPFRVTGRASAPDGTVQWELMQGDTLVRHGSAPAGRCCTLSPYSFTVSAPPGAYTLVVRDQNTSGGKGVARSEDSKAVLVH